MLWRLRGGVPEIQLRILQSLLPLIANYSEQIHGEQLRLLFSIALFLYGNKSSVQMVHHTAVASIRQLATSVFERVEKSSQVTGNSHTNTQQENAVSLLNMEDATAFLKVGIYPNSRTLLYEAAGIPCSFCTIFAWTWSLL